MSARYLGRKSATQIQIHTRWNEYIGKSEAHENRNKYWNQVWNCFHFMNMIIYMSLERGISRRVCRLRMYFFLRFFFVVIISLESLHRVGPYYITLKLQSSINWMAYAQCKTSTQPNSAQHKTIQDKTRLDMIHFIVVCIYVGNCDLCAEWSLQHCVRSITVHSCHLCAECILIIRCIWKKKKQHKNCFRNH